jgi:hypothetical protein
LVGLFHFLLRLACGLSAAMAVTSPRLVTSGYFRNNLYVILGLNVLAALIAWRSASDTPMATWSAIVASVLSYVGAVMWLYEKPKPGVVILALIAVVTLLGLWLSGTGGLDSSATIRTLRWIEPVAAAALLGTTMGAMLLGHWYLNSPGMKLAPLDRLIALMGLAVIVRVILCGLALVMLLQSDTPLTVTHTALLTMRWLAGLAGPAVMAWMSWQTLRIPNTQSATGILYVGVIGVFLGEMIAALLSGELGYPV